MLDEIRDEVKDFDEESAPVNKKRETEKEKKDRILAEKMSQTKITPRDQPKQTKPETRSVQPSQQLVSISAIRLDGQTQMREQMDQAAIADYAEHFKAGARFPAVELFQEGDSYWLANGFHRVEAAKRAKQKEILAVVRQGEKRDAVLAACRANAKHGVRRTNADKRKVVLTLLNDAEWANWSDHKIAEACCVSQPMVSKLRKQVITVINSKEPQPVQGRDGKTYSRPVPKPETTSPEKASSSTETLSKEEPSECLAVDDAEDEPEEASSPSNGEILMLKHETEGMVRGLLEGLPAHVHYAIGEFLIDLGGRLKDE